MRELFLHVHPNKTGGTSIRRTLGITHQPEHLRAVHLRKLYAGSWRDAFKFSIIRNPYDRVVSMYEYRKRIDHRGLGSSGTSFEDGSVRSFSIAPGFTSISRSFSSLSLSEGSKMSRIPPRPDRAEIRSVTPPGFSQAFFEANK